MCLLLTITTTGTQLRSENLRMLRILSANFLRYTAPVLRGVITNMYESTMKKISIIILLFLSGCSVLLSESRVDKSVAFEVSSHGLKLVQYLESRDIENAMKLLRAKSVALDSSISNEDSMVLELLHLESVDSDLVDVMDKLVKSYSNEKLAYVARGTYLKGKAHRARGEKWISETSKAQIENMVRIQELAIRDFKRAIAIDESYYIPYFQLGLIYGMRRDDSAIATVNFRKAIELRADSYWGWAFYLERLAPRWGGSYMEMDRAIEEMAIHVSGNKNLGLLQASIDYDKGNLAQINKDYATAKDFYNKALRYGRHPGSINGLGSIYLKEKNYALGCPLIREVVNMRPYNRTYNSNLIYCKSKGY